MRKCWHTWAGRPSCLSQSVHGLVGRRGHLLYTFRFFATTISVLFNSNVRNHRSRLSVYVGGRRSGVAHHQSRQASKAYSDVLSEVTSVGHMNAIKIEANMMIKRGMQVLQRVFMLSCIPMQALHSAYAVAPLTFISSFIPATAWAAPEDCCSCFAPSGDPCGYLEG